MQGGVGALPLLLLSVLRALFRSPRFTQAQKSLLYDFRGLPLLLRKRFLSSEPRVMGFSPGFGSKYRASLLCSIREHICY